MALTIGIVGLPNVGKSTLFNALTKNDVLAANYPFATIEPNVGVVGVPDARLTKLAEIFDSQKLIPAAVSFVDIAGIVRGASEGQGLGNKFLANIREADAICQVIRVFEDPDVVHVDGEVSPERRHRDHQHRADPGRPADDREGAARMEKEARLKKGGAEQVAAIEEAQKVLDSGRPSSRRRRPRAAARAALLTAKPFLYVFNVDEAELGNAAPARAARPGRAGRGDLPRRQDRVGADRAARRRGARAAAVARAGGERPLPLARVGFDTLGLQTYLTAGPKESRAWTIRKGDTAPEAAGVIHTDFQRGFIKAEVVSFDDLVDAGSMAAARAAARPASRARTT